MSSVRVVCFDLDDTLVSERDYVVSGLRAVGGEIDRRFGDVGRAGEWLTSEWLRTRRADVIQAYLRERGGDGMEWVVPLRRLYRRHLPTIRPRPGVLELLGTLHRRGRALALVSDGYLDAQRRKWEALGIGGWFDLVLFTDEFGREFWKPHPRAFENVMSRWPEAEGFTYVGDNVEKDFLAPNRLGWLTVRVEHPDNLQPAVAARGDARPGRVANSMEDLMDLL